MHLSNIIEDGRAIGLNDAGQAWHTDMSYSEPIAYLNVLYAIEVPRRDGRAVARVDGLPPGEARPEDDDAKDGEAQRRPRGDLAAAPPPVEGRAALGPVGAAGGERHVRHRRELMT